LQAQQSSASGVLRIRHGVRGVPGFKSRTTL
jgi:hypothetical protein